MKILLVKYWKVLSEAVRKFCLEEINRYALAVNFRVFRLEVAVTCRWFLTEVYARFAAVLPVFQIGARCRVDAVLIAVAIDFFFTQRIQIGFSNVEIVSPGTNYEKKVSVFFNCSKTNLFNIKILFNIHVKV